MSREAITALIADAELELQQANNYITEETAWFQSEVARVAALTNDLENKIAALQKQLEP